MGKIVAGPRSQVTFTCHAFNTSVEKEEFLNPGNFGDDLAQWLTQRLKALGWETDEVSQEDHGWTFTFTKGETRCDLVVGMIDDEPGHWLAWIEPCAGILSSIFGGRNKPVPAEAPLTIHQVLTNAPEVEEVQWFPRGSSMLDEPGASHPTDPSGP